MAHSLYDITALQPFIQQGCTFLTPNARLARRIKSEWDSTQLASGQRVWEPLPVLPLEQWLRNCWQQAVARGAIAPRLPLDKLQELQLWGQAIDRHTTQTNTVSLLNPNSAAELACEARDLILRWEIDVEAADTLQLFSLDGDCATFLSWLRLFEAQLASAQLCTAADCLVDLAALEREASAASVVLLECPELSPLVQHCLSSQCGRVEHFDVPAAPAQAVLHAYADQQAELRGVAGWTAAIHRESPHATVGVVLSGAQPAALEYQLRREFDCLGDNYNSLPVNFSAGISLSDAPVVRDALALLCLAQDRISVATVVALFSSRFLQLPDAHSALAQYFLRRLYDGGSAEIESGALRNFATTVSEGEHTGLAFGECLLQVSQMRELRGKRLPSAWVPFVQNVLEVWGWPGEGDLDSLEFQQVRRWYENLETFATLDAVCPPLTFSAALQLLRESCERQVSHPQTADSPVQVLGPLEAAGLAFDHLWICGMQGSAWPAAPRPNPMIPLSLQTALQMPHATPEREWQFGEALLAQYRRTCGAVHASYSRQVDGIADLPSGLLEDFQELPVDPSIALPADWVQRLSSAQLERVDDQQAPALTADERDAMRGGAGLLEAQSQCPFRAFARYRLQVEPLSAPVAGIAPQERGNIVHEALHILWRDIGSHGALLALTDEALAALLQRAVEVGLQAVPGYRRAALGAACMELEAVRLHALLLEWLAVERQRGEFQVTAREESVELSLSQLRIRLRVDRMDQLPDGSQVIIDYKTGAANVNDWLGERPSKPQLLLYGLAVQEPPAALSFARLKPRESAYVGIGVVDSIPGVTNDIAAAVKGRVDAASWAELNTTWRAVLERLAREFVDGEAAVDPLRNSCTYCGLQALCRIEVDQAEDEEAGEADDPAGVPL